MQAQPPASGSDFAPSPVSTARIPKKKRLEDSEEENQDDIFLIDDGDENEAHEHYPQQPEQSTGEAEGQNMVGYRFSGTGELNLPEGVQLPPTITPELMSDRLREMLFQLPVDLMRDAFHEYDTAVTLKGDSIRSHQAYLHGVLKRYVQLIEKEKETQANTAMGKELTQEVKNRLKKVVERKYCEEEDLKNDRILAKLESLPEKDALNSIDELLGVDPSIIRNLQSYFIGILNKYQRGEGRAQRAEARKKEGQVGKSDKRVEDRTRSRRDSRNRSRSPEYRRRSRSRSPEYRRRDDDRSGRGRRHQRDSSRSRSPEYRRSRRHYDDGDDDYRYHKRDKRSRSRSRSPNSHRRRHDDDYRRNDYSVQKDDKPRFSSDVVPSRIPGPPVPTFPGQLPGQLQTSMGMLNNPQQQAMNQFGLLQQQTHPVFPGTQASQQQAGQLQQPQFSTVQSHFPQPQNFPLPPSIQQQWAGQKLAQLSGFAGQFLQQQQAPGAGFSQPLQMPPGQPQWSEHADILGLAEKAEAAVKLLGSQNQLSLGQQQYSVAGQQFPPPPPNMAIQQLMPGAQYGLTNPQQQQQLQQPNAAIQSRQKITQNDLPITIQYALQNLMASGHIDGPSLDPGLNRLLLMLPESSALEALQSLATIDTTRIRNKAGYLAGILKKQLQKNGLSV